MSRTSLDTVENVAVQWFKNVSLIFLFLDTHVLPTPICFPPFKTLHLFWLLFHCDVWVLSLKDGFSQIKSLYTYWNCLSSLAVFPLSRQITHYYNHSAIQTTCFEDQIAICAESGFGTFSCRLILYRYHRMMNVTMKRQIEPQSFLIVVITCVLWLCSASVRRARMKCCFSVFTHVG